MPTSARFLYLPPLPRRPNAPREPDVHHRLQRADGTRSRKSRGQQQLQMSLRITIDLPRPYFDPLPGPQAKVSLNYAWGETRTGEHHHD